MSSTQSSIQPKKQTSKVIFVQTDTPVIFNCGFSCKVWKECHGSQLQKLTICLVENMIDAGLVKHDILKRGLAGKITAAIRDDWLGKK